MPITVGTGISVGGSITIGEVPVPTLLLQLDAVNYSGSGTAWPAGVGSGATLFNTPTYTSASPTFFSFDKNSFEYATVSDLGSLTTWTVEAWLRVTASLTGQVTSVVTNQYNGTTSLNFSIGTNNAPTTYNLVVGYFQSAWYNTAGFTPTLNTWYYIVGTYDGATVRQYNNGALNTTVSTAVAPASGGEIRVGRRWDSLANDAANFFPGDIAVVRVYSGPKSAATVLNDYNDQKGRFGL